MKVKVDEELCIGDGSCEDICPEIFEMNDADVAETKIGENEPVPRDLEAPCREAAESCPVDAIIVEE